MGNNYHEFDFDGAHKPCLVNESSENPICLGEKNCALFAFCTFSFRLGEQTEKTTSWERKKRTSQLQIFQLTQK